MGNWWSSDDQLLDVRHNFLTKPTIERFRTIEDNLPWHAKCNYTYRTWHTACLYTFMLEEKTNLSSPELICDYLEIEHEVIKGFQKS